MPSDHAHARRHRHRGLRQAEGHPQGRLHHLESHRLGAGTITQQATTGSRKLKRWCRVTKRTDGAGVHTLKCNLGSKGRKALRKSSLKLTLRTTFTPTTGSAVTKDRKLTLKRKR